MIEEKYQRLSLSEQEQFSRVVNRLLSNTFLLVEDYDPAEGISKVNREYLFVERNFDLFQDYLPHHEAIRNPLLVCYSLTS